MMMPPAAPARNRQTKNQTNETGTEHAKHDNVASIIIARNAHVEPSRAAIGRANNAPAR